jgi:hypothetical protein
MFRRFQLAYFSPETGSGGGSSFPSMEQVNEFLSNSETPAETVVTPEVETTPEIQTHSEPVEKTVQVEAPKHKLKVDGVEREFTQEELYENASKGLDYTKKTQELAEQRKQLEEMQNFVEYVSSKPELAQQMAKLVEDYENGDISEKQMMNKVDKLQAEVPTPSEKPNFSADPEFQSMKQELAELKQFREQQEVSFQQEELNKEIETFLEEYPDLKENTTLRDEIFKHADDNGLKLRTAYRDKMFDEVAGKTKQQMVKDNMRKQISTTTPTGNSTGGKEPVEKLETFDDIRKSILSGDYKLTL